jgi:toxin ParE1/3/4
MPRKPGRRRTPVGRLLFRPAAEADLAELYESIIQRGGTPETAIGYIRRIRETCDRLRAFPEIGHVRDDLRPGIRILGFERRVVIAYKILPAGDVEIGRILYGGRDYDALLSLSDDA